MFDEKYIMTGIVAMLLTAAWQKPALYKEHLSNKVIFLAMALWCLFATWDVSIDVSAMNLPEGLDEDTKLLVTESIKNNSVPLTWWVFNAVIFIGSFVLDWLANISLKQESKA
jgi:hypothetical protein